MEQGDFIGRLKSALDGIDEAQLGRLINKIHSLIGEPRTLFIAGNGGSAAAASHISCDLAKTILGESPRNKPNRLRTICLNDNIPLMTAWANDEGYEHIFAQQLVSLGQKPDLLVVITGSGNSTNIVEAVNAARGLGIETYGILGFDGGKVKKMVDDYLLIPSDDYGIIEATHAVLGHLITDRLKNMYSGHPKNERVNTLVS